MKKIISSAISLILVLAMIFGLAMSGSAKAGFTNYAYSTVITASDFQGDTPASFERFQRILTLMKNDGLKTPHSVISGGDYSKIWPDYATPGVARVKEAYLAVYPDADEKMVVCTQGNHDFVSSGFTRTGYYDMGTYNLYVINENDFPWNQFLRIPETIKLTANKLNKTLDSLISKGDKRPVIIVTHVPLHHSSRTGGGDNMYSSFLFDVINEAAKKLDIVFIFGHNHSDNYDDYIGGAVNFIPRGGKIRIPLTNKMGDGCYTERTLNFTYTNCGYVGYSGNGTENGSTDKLTVGAIQFTKSYIRFVRYSEDGLFRTDVVSRINPGTLTKAVEEKPVMVNEYLYSVMVNFFGIIRKVFSIR